MKVKINPKNLSGNIRSISSKSHAHRVLICGAFAQGQSKITLESSNVDIETTMECLQSLGAKFNRNGEDITITPLEGEVVNKSLNCRESGSTLRFMLPVAAAFSKSVNFMGQGRLPERPLDHLIEQMQEHGVKFNSKKLPFTTDGKLRGGEFILPGNISSQYISGLLLAAPILGEELTVKLSSPLESKAYVNMTIQAMEDFGVKVNVNENSYRVARGQRYCEPKQMIIEGDWSNAAFFLSAGALGSGVSVKGLSMDSTQGDREIVNILKKFGAKISVEKDIISVDSGELKGVEVDVSEIPDLLPILSIVATKAFGESIFTNAARLRIKESDRLSSMKSVIESLGGKVVEGEDFLKVIGTGGLKGGVVNSYNDHRIAMSSAVASIISENPVEIVGAEAVNKSYPGFYKDFESLGGEINVL